MRPRTHSLWAAALLLCGLASHAQTVYRCGNSYSQQPCAGGAPIEASDPRTPAEAARASSVAAADAKRADSMEKARLAQEKNAPKAGAIAPLPAASQARPQARNGAHGKTGKPDVYTAKAPRQRDDEKKKGNEKENKKASQHVLD